MPDVPRIDGSRHVEGLLAPPPSPGIARSVAVPQANGTLLATSLDPDLLRTALQQARIAPRVLRLDPQSPIGYERDLAMLPNTLPPEKHLGYAVQWFALALAVLATALLLTLRKAKP
jgi:cytochrome oxidase assembly protein ShyY1